MYVTQLLCSAPAPPQVSSRALYQKDSLGEGVQPNPSYPTMRPKVDENRNYGEGLPAGGRSSPAGAWLQGTAHQKQGVAGKPEAAALCRALQDFNPREMDLEDWKYCLGFAKVGPGAPNPETLKPWMSHPVEERLDQR